jgi:hypothetical protein
MPEKGEFTVVAEIGQSTNHTDQPVDIVGEFCQMTSDGRRLSKRQAVAQLARKHGLPPNEVYRAIEDAKKSGERPTAMPSD